MSVHEHVHGSSAALEFRTCGIRAQRFIQVGKQMGSPGAVTDAEGPGRQHQFLNFTTDAASRKVSYSKNFLYRKVGLFVIFAVSQA